MRNLLFSVDSHFTLGKFLLAQFPWPYLKGALGNMTSLEAVQWRTPLRYFQGPAMMPSWYTPPCSSSPFHKLGPEERVSDSIYWAFRSVGFEGTTSWVPEWLWGREVLLHQPGTFNLDYYVAINKLFCVLHYFIWVYLL